MTLLPKKNAKCAIWRFRSNRGSALIAIIFKTAGLWLFFIRPPRFFFACLPMAVMLIAFATLFDTGEKYEIYKNQITITDTQIALGDTKSGATVAVIGLIKNTSRVSWKEILFHVDFLDAAGKRVDVGEREDYNFRLPAGETSSFKVSFRREFSETNYVQPVVRIVGAKDERARW